ncbi:MAG TPA: ferric reductase-like transmembrane domain-containing protein [Solirubrobacterales bacterium]|nr:ferric reductase-like transmembrane domain-containing protein [Solirubrobacterales bacterium]
MITAIPHTLATHGWWLASRASGIVALVLVTISVGIGLTMAGKPLRRPGLSRKLLAIHEQTALAALVAIAVHGISLLADPWLQPGVAGVAVPFAMGIHTFWTGLGTIAGYMAFLLGLSFYLRKRVGPKLWRKAHRATAAVYLLGLIHALGAGSDTSTAWFRIWAVATGVPIALLFVYRLGVERRAERRRASASRVRRRQGVRGGYEQPLTVR